MVINIISTTICDTLLNRSEWYMGWIPACGESTPRIAEKYSGGLTEYCGIILLE